MPVLLQYSQSEPPVRSLALPAFVCGLCSGPVAFGLAVFAAANHLREQTKELLGLLAFLTILGGALVFSCVARAKLPSEATWRLRLFANVAIAAPIVWCVAIFAFIAYLLKQV
jgi:hypothetical protein